MLPSVTAVGERHGVRERMARYDVPGLSVAVVRGGHVDWAQGYGRRAAGGADSVTTSTLFQAASISKPLTAALALRLADQGRLSLDADLGTLLRSWTIPPTLHTRGRPPTLRDALRHSAGFTVGGFPGYAVGDSIPSAVGVLEGRGNTPAVRVDTIPGTLYRYSGGGYVAAQVAIEEVVGAPFVDVMAREVLWPLGMTRSTFAQPLPARLADDVAQAHDEAGAPVPGGWHVYPEIAPAGLWSTPTDVARFALDLRAAYLGEPGALLAPETARAMLTTDALGAGIGLQVAEAEGGPLFLHTGSNEGYKAIMVLYAGTGDGAVVMTNGENGGDLMMEVLRAVSAAYGWPNFRSRTYEPVAVDPATLDRLVGTYTFVEFPEYHVGIERAGAGLAVVWPEEPPARLVAASPTEFYVEAEGTALVFDADGSGLLWDGEDRAERAD